MSSYPIPSPAFIRQLKQFEGFRSRPYLCPAKHASIGYGLNLEAHPRYIPAEELRRMAAGGLLKGEELVKALRTRGLMWSENTAEIVLLNEVKALSDELTLRCPVYRDVAARGQCERAEALLDMAYNMGVGRPPEKGRKGCGLLSFTVFLERMQQSDYVRASEGLARSLWARQTGRRARILMEQIRTGRYQENAR